MSSRHFHYCYQGESDSLEGKSRRVSLPAWKSAGAKAQGRSLPRVNDVVSTGLEESSKLEILFWIICLSCSFMNIRFIDYVGKTREISGAYWRRGLLRERGACREGWC